MLWQKKKKWVWWIVYWVLSHLPRRDKYYFYSHCIGKSKSHGHAQLPDGGEVQLSYVSRRRTENIWELSIMTTTLPFWNSIRCLLDFLILSSTSIHSSFMVSLYLSLSLSCISLDNSWVISSSISRLLFNLTLTFNL